MNEKIDSLTTVEIGARLSLVRQGLGLTQSEVAKIINITQTKLSKIEKGHVVTTPIFLRLLSFYSQSISLDVLFAEKMDFVTHENLFNKDFALTKIVKERIEVLKEEVSSKLEALQTKAEQALEDTISLL